VGTFDPYSDDPRLGIQKLQFCPLVETLVVAGTAGQIVIMQFEREARDLEVRVTPVNIVSDRDEFVWKGRKLIYKEFSRNHIHIGFIKLDIYS
jgi:lethal(2) giant larvae protein